MAGDYLVAEIKQLRHELHFLEEIKRTDPSEVGQSYADHHIFVVKAALLKKEKELGTRL